MFDPQIGRFQQNDPLADWNESWSPYCFVNDNPILLIDPMGMMADSAGKGVVVKQLEPVTVTAVSPCKFNLWTSKY
jgi:hypothetical protein